MPLWRHAAVGPSANRKETAIAAMLPAVNERRDAASDSKRRSTTDSFHAPGADKSGRRPKPPASEPAMAPTVFQA
jgi:hypothetical protein